MIQTFLVIHPDGTLKSFCCEKEDRLQAFYKIIGSEWLVQVPTIWRDVFLIIDMYVKLKDPLQSVNLLASQMADPSRRNLWTINGPAIIAKLSPVGPDGELDWCEFNRSELAYLCDLLGVSPIE